MDEKEIRETILIGLLSLTKTEEQKAKILQSYTQKYGSVSDETAEIIREELQR